MQLGAFYKLLVITTPCGLNLHIVLKEIVKIICPQHIKIIFSLKTLLNIDFYYFCPPKKRDVSSVGLERLLDRQEVTGSIPVRPTILIIWTYYMSFFYIPDFK